MGVTRVYIGGLPITCTEQDLKRFLRGYGKLKDILRYKRGFAFVEFEDSRDAEDAIHELDGTKLLGKRVPVDIARWVPRSLTKWLTRRNKFQSNGALTRTGYRLIVENLSSSVSRHDLKDCLGQAGEVIFADVHKQYINEGVVEFASYSGVEKAIQMFDNIELNGRRIQLVDGKNSRDRRADSYSSRSTCTSRSRSSRRRSRSRSRSSSISRSRSRSRYSSHSKRKSKSRSRSRDSSVTRYYGNKSRSRLKSRKMSVGRSRSNSREKSVERQVAIAGRLLEKGYRSCSFKFMFANSMFDTFGNKQLKQL